MNINSNFIYDIQKQIYILLFRIRKKIEKKIMEKLN